MLTAAKDRGQEPKFFISNLKKFGSRMRGLVFFKDKQRLFITHIMGSRFSNNLSSQVSIGQTADSLFFQSILCFNQLQDIFLNKRDLVIKNATDLVKVVRTGRRLKIDKCGNFSILQLCTCLCSPEMSQFAGKYSN